MLNMFRTKRGYRARDRGARHGRARDMQTAGEDDPAAVRRNDHALCALFCFR